MNYAADVIAVQFARRCLHFPRQLRWARFVGSIYRGNANRFFSWEDYFPAYHVIGPEWVGRDRLSTRVGSSSLY